MSKDYAGLVKRLREMAEHGGAPSRLATMRAAADALEALAKELGEARRNILNLIKQRNKAASALAAMTTERDEMLAQRQRLYTDRALDLAWDIHNGITFHGWADKDIADYICRKMSVDTLEARADAQSWEGEPSTLLADARLLADAVLHTDAQYQAVGCPGEDENLVKAARRIVGGKP